MGIPVKLEAFEGPLDLLLHLIDKNKVNIYDIPIVGDLPLSTVEYIHEMQRQDLNVMSEFLLMAATLLAIKSKMLLPKEIDEEERGGGSPVRSWWNSFWSTSSTNICPTSFGICRRTRPM